MKITKSKAQHKFLPSGKIEVWHSASVKLNVNYQSAECSFGMKAEADAETLNDAEQFVTTEVEKLMGPKIEELTQFLKSLS